MAELVFFRGDREVLRYPLQGCLRLGRHPENDLSLPEESISRFHCTIEPKEGNFCLTDRSRNGTFVNGRSVQSVTLQDQDKIEVGPWRLQYRQTDDWRDRETILEKRGYLPASFCGMVGKSPLMQELFSLIGRLGPLPAPVLILGETGTGKELVARALHNLSPRREGPFVAINCGAISRELIESELFGHERGAFTGALDRHAGSFEQAQGGTLFLDEIGELPLELQPKLLRVLEEQTIRRVGGRGEVRVDVRILAATHRDLPLLIQQGRFREDLFYRLDTIPLKVPPLNQRTEDIPLLAEYFLGQLKPEGGIALTDDAWAKLKGHSWRGNVRELKNVLLRALLTCGTLISAEGLQFSLPEGRGPHSLQSMQKEAILKALRENAWNKSRAAASLGIAKSTLFQKIKEFGIRRS